MTTNKQLFEQITELCAKLDEICPYKTWVGIRKEDLNRTLERLNLKLNTNTTVDINNDVRVKSLENQSLEFEESTRSKDTTEINIEAKHNHNNRVVSTVLTTSSNSTQSKSSLAFAELLKSQQLSADDNHQNAIFWLKRCYIQWNENTVKFATRIGKKVLDDSNATEVLLSQQEIDKHNQRIRDFKEFLTFTFDKPYFDNQEQAAKFGKFINRLDATGWIVETDDTFGTITVVPDSFSTADNVAKTKYKVKMSEVIRLRALQDGYPVTNEYLENFFVEKIFTLKTPLRTALWLLSGSAEMTTSNQILVSYLRLNVGSNTREIMLNGSMYHIETGFTITQPRNYESKKSVSIKVLQKSTDYHHLQNEVTNRFSGKVSKNNIVTTRSRADKHVHDTERDSWTNILQNSRQQILLHSNTKYSDCTIVVKPITKKKDEFSILQYPTWLQDYCKINKQFGIPIDGLLSYVGIRYPNGSVTRVGILFLKKSKLWFASLPIVEKRESIHYVPDTEGEKQKYNLQQVVKYERVNGVVVKQYSTRWTTPMKAITSNELTTENLPLEIRQFLSLVGLQSDTNNRPQCVVPGKSINGQNLVINWSKLLGLNLVSIGENTIGNLRQQPYKLV